MYNYAQIADYAIWLWLRFFLGCGVLSFIGGKAYGMV